MPSIMTRFAPPSILFAGLMAGVAIAQGDRSSPRDLGDPRAIIKNLDLRDRPLKDVVDFLRAKSGTNIILDDGIDTPVTLRELKDMHWRTVLDLAVERAGCVVVEAGPNVLRVEKPPRVRFAFDKAEISQVIDAIAKISAANIITAPEVQGTITLRLKDVPWRDALDQVVKTLGFTVVEEDRGILRVVSPATLVDQLSSREFQLRYVRPASSFVPKIKSEYVDGQIFRAGDDPAKNFGLVQALQRMLSPAGKIEYLAGKNVLFVKDTKPVLDEVERMISKIDVEPKQVFVDVKFVTTRNTNLLEYGVNVGDTGWSVSASGGAIPIKFPFNLGGGGFEDSLIANDSGRGPFADAALNASNQTIVPNTIFGALDFTQVSATLRLLKKDESSEIVQAPKIIALDHEPATIFVGDTVRYAQARAESSQSGGLQLVVEEAPNSPVQTGFQLLLTPHIIPGTDKVIMEVIPESEQLSGSGGPPLAPPGFDVFTVGSGTGQGSIALPRVSASTIATKMLLKSGQTAVLGGLTTDSNTRTTTSIPLLGDIPILGWAFKSRAKSNQRTSLIVFITPEIVMSPEETEANIRDILEIRRTAMASEYRRIFGEPSQPSTDTSDVAAPGADR